MAEPILKKYTKSAQAESNPTEPNTDDDINIELRKEFLMELKNNAYHGMFDEDVWTTLLRNLTMETPLNTATDSFFKAYDEHDIEEGNELRQMKRKKENKNDEQPNKRVCNAEKFEAIKYSLGPNEEYIAIRRCEYNGWERNKDSMSQIYQEIFKKRTKDGR
ncbi:hypothetical protein Tco_0617460 [Tanacetum coccineum]